MPRTKRSSIVKQTIDRLKSMYSLGESRHRAKKEYREKMEAQGIKVSSNRVPGKIFSGKTFEDYKNRCINFVKYARNKFGFLNLEEIEKDHVRIVNDYIDFLEQDKSPYTIHGYISAISMLLGTKNTDYELPKKNYLAISKNRVDPDEPRKGFDQNKHQELLRFVKATGLRRIELSKIRPEQVVKNAWGDVTIKVTKNQAKGGLPRTVYPIQEEAEWVYNFAKDKQASGKIRIFSKKDGELPKYAPYHPCRAVFAERKYQEALRSHSTGEIYKRWGDKRTFDRGALQVVSENLGHNRIGICIQNYLWRSEMN